MSDVKDAIRAVVQNLIKDDTEAAAAAFHPALTAKMREVSGIGAPAQSQTNDYEDVVDATDEDVSLGNDDE